METNYILTDNVNVAGPILIVKLTLLVNGIPHSGDIVGKRIYPNVDNVLFIKLNGNTPFERRTRNTKPNGTSNFDRFAGFSSADY